MDGVPGVQQCPIAPGDTFTYRFIADLYGSSWYHSHYSAQYGAGIVGAMIIYGPANYDYDIDMGPVFLQDCYHTDYRQLINEVMTPNVQTSVGAGVSDNNLINGKNNFNCSSVQTTTPCNSNAGISKFYFQPGKWHRLRLINAGAEGLQHFSIDGHTMDIIAADFVPMVRSTHNVVPLAIGQRLDVLVKGIGNPGESYYMRSVIQPCGSGEKNPLALGAILYPGADENTPPTSEPWVDELPPCQDLDPSYLSPFYPESPQTPAESYSVEIAFGPNATGYWLWTMNGISYRAFYDEPTLLMTKAVANISQPYQFPDYYNVYTTNPGNDTTQVVLFHFENTVSIAHPMHFHGHNMYLLAQGNGSWDGTITSNPNPPRRDVFLCPPSGHLVFSYNATNPGAWPMHCHIAWHVSAGLFIQTVEQSDWIQKYMDIPDAFADQCRQWWNYSGHNVVSYSICIYLILGP
jgi:FtsP/CotA-like multicopper oxidase with cupredoxin domain